MLERARNADKPREVIEALKIKLLRAKEALAKRKEPKPKTKKKEPKK